VENDSDVSAAGRQHGHLVGVGDRAYPVPQTPPTRAPTRDPGRLDHRPRSPTARHGRIPRRMTDRGPARRVCVAF